MLRKQLQGSGIVNAVFFSFSVFFSVSVLRLFNNYSLALFKYRDQYFFRQILHADLKNKHLIDEINIRNANIYTFRAGNIAYNLVLIFHKNAVFCIHYKT